MGRVSAPAARAVPPAPAVQENVLVRALRLGLLCVIGAGGVGGGAGAIGIGVGIGISLGAGQGAAGAAEAGPLSAAQQGVVESPPAENPYQVRTHFLTSNERRHDLFFPALRGRGGAYVGVGADQNYTLAAVAGAELLWLVDIDAEVILWHQIYAALVPAAQTPEELCRLLDGAHALEVAAALEARWTGEVPGVLFRAYRRDRGRIFAHVSREAARKAGPPSWLSDPALYAHVRALMQQRRVVARVGDLHGERTLLGIGEAARKAGAVVRVVYLSNVEQWFRYTDQFRRNLAGLPRDDRTIVLRTLARRELAPAPGDRWHFSVQALSDFVERMEGGAGPAREGGLHRVHDLMLEMARAGSGPQATRGLSLLPGVKLLPAGTSPGGASPGPGPGSGAGAPHAFALPAFLPRCSWAR